MLLKITNYCTMGCNHCFQDSNPKGEHMTKDIFKRSLDFIKQLNPSILLISGGEPTDHPLFFEFINDLLGVFKKEQLVIISNGQFLNDSEKRKKIMGLKIQVQVTNDERYYPTKIITDYNYKNLIIERHIPTLYPQGRAVTNNLNAPQGVTAPKCFNIRSICLRNASALQMAIRLLEGYGKFCTPLIGEDGKVYVGESVLCTSVGDVDTPLAEILKNIRNLKCNKCGMEDKLSSVHRSIINQSML